jgi:hypothetical protein
VCCHTSPLSFPNLNSFSGSQTGRRVSFQLIVKDCLVPRLLGPTKSTMAIARFPLIWSHSWRRLFHSSILDSSMYLGQGPKPPPLPPQR